MPSSKLDEFDFVPLASLDPYNDAIEAILKGSEIPDSFHEFESSGSKNGDYDAVLHEKDVRARVGFIGRIFRPTTPLVYEINDDRLLVNEGLFEACLARIRKEKWIKVLMPVDIADQWDSRSTVELDKVCEQQGRDQIYTPVMHPAYRNFKYSRAGRSRLDMIRRFLGPRVRDMTLLDIGCNCGYYLYHFRRQGMRVTGVDIDPEHLAIAAAQAPMYGLDVDLRNISLKEFIADEPYDVVLSLSVFWHILGWGDLPTVLSEDELTSRIDKLVGKYLFWESGPDSDREISLIRENTGLKEFVQLGTTSATGIDDRIFGVFVRNAPR